MADELADEKVGTTVRLPQDLIERIERAQKTADLNRSQAIRRIIQFGLPMFESWVKKAYSELDPPGKRPTH